MRRAYEAFVGWGRRGSRLPRGAQIHVDLHHPGWRALNKFQDGDGLSFQRVSISIGILRVWCGAGTTQSLYPVSRMHENLMHQISDSHKRSAKTSTSLRVGAEVPPNPNVYRRTEQGLCSRSLVVRTWSLKEAREKLPPWKRYRCSVILHLQISISAPMLVCGALQRPY